MAEEKKEVTIDAPDEESQKIMDEIEEDKAKAEEETKVEETTEEPKEEAEESEEESDKDSEEESEEEESEEDKKDETTDDKEEKEEVEEAKVSRTPKVMPIYKHKIKEKEWQKKYNAIEQELKEAKSKPTVEQTDKAKTLADKYGVEEGLITDLIEAVGSNIKPDEGVKKQLDNLASAQAEAKELEAFDNEFKSDIATLDSIKKENLDEAKKLLKELAFTEEYAKVPLKKIIRFAEFDKFKGEPKKGKKSAESSKTGKRGNVVKYEDWTNEDWKNASDSEFDKASEYMAGSQSKYAIQRNGKTVKD